MRTHERRRRRRREDVENSGLEEAFAEGRGRGGGDRRWRGRRNEKKVEDVLDEEKKRGRGG